MPTKAILKGPIQRRPSSPKPLLRPLGRDPKGQDPDQCPGRQTYPQRISRQHVRHIIPFQGNKELKRNTGIRWNVK